MVRGHGQRQGLVNWSSRILEDKNFPRGQHIINYQFLRFCIFLRHDILGGVATPRHAPMCVPVCAYICLQTDLRQSRMHILLWHYVGDNRFVDFIWFRFYIM